MTVAEALMLAADPARYAQLRFWRWVEALRAGLIDRETCEKALRNKQEAA